MYNNIKGDYMKDYTKKAIRDAFIELLETKQLKQITVKDIVEECQINRNTFYYHYEDIPDLLNTIIKENADRIVEKYPVVDSLDDCIMAVLDLALSNKKAVLHIYSSISRDVYESYQWKICDYVSRKYISTITGLKELKDEHLDIVVDYTKCVVFGICTYWLENGMNEEIEEKIKILCNVKQGDLEETIKRIKNFY